MISLAISGSAIIGTTVLVTAPQASAASWDHRMLSGDINPGAAIRFVQRGDVVQVCDIEADSYTAYGRVSWSTKSYSLRVAGRGRCIQTDARTHNLPEKTKITFRICLQKASDKYYCHTTKWYNGR